MANMTAPIRLSGLARRLVSEGLLSEEQAQTAQVTAKQASQSFVTYLVNNKLLDSDVIGAIASQEFGVPLFDLDSMNMELAPTSLFQENSSVSIMPYRCFNVVNVFMWPCPILPIFRPWMNSSSTLL